ncbi:MAG: hypothetical protein J6B81_01680 [Spirochaetaceae bacterium]|nr:hypothetical protein [Spirochaetaceae bacterium]
MDIVINGTKADITLDEEKKLGQVLAALEEEFSHNQATTVAISVNGKSVLAEEFNSITEMPIEEVSTLNLTTVTQDDILISFKEIGQEFSLIAENLKQLSIMFQNGQDKTAVETVKRLADAVNSFCHVATLSTLFPEKFADIKLNNMSVSDFFAELSPILTDFEQGFQNSDSVLMGDLAEYEICPRIEAIINMTKNLV